MLTDPTRPALRLPPEVLSDIVKRAVADGMNPFYLAHVCRYWREVVNGIKTLWNHIHIKVIGIPNVG
jgi:hypothetical protein